MYPDTKYAESSRDVYSLTFSTLSLVTISTLLVFYLSTQSLQSWRVSGEYEVNAVASP